MAKDMQVLTAESEAGREALAAVMSRSYNAETAGVPPKWARVLLVDGAPVSFILVDPERRMDFAAGQLPYAFICDVATRSDRRGEGHFRAIMEHTFASLRAAGITAVVTHGRHQLYRRFGFDVFTHHAGLFASPGLIERTLGTGAPPGAERMLSVAGESFIHDDLLLITGVRARSLNECRAALQAAASLARRRAKLRILFEYPPAPSYGSHYPIFPSLDTPFLRLGRGIGAEFRLQGDAPEEGVAPDADWIRVLYAPGFARAALACLPQRERPETEVCLETEHAEVTLHSEANQVIVTEDGGARMERVRWPSAALAQLVTGYASARVLAAQHDLLLSAGACALLEALFPTAWRFSRNESWTYKS
jgi:predicted N-acetyltransferase YhbS